MALSDQTHQISGQYFFSLDYSQSPIEGIGSQKARNKFLSVGQNGHKNHNFFSSSFKDLNLHEDIMHLAKNVM
jgi:hypothetical protein